MCEQILLKISNIKLHENPSGGGHPRTCGLLVCEHAIAQAVVRRLLTALPSIFGICGGKSGTWTGFSPSCSVSPFHSFLIYPVFLYLSSVKWETGPMRQLTHRLLVSPHNGNIKRQIIVTYGLSP